MVGVELETTKLNQRSESENQTCATTGNSGCLASGVAIRSQERTVPTRYGSSAVVVADGISRDRLSSLLKAYKQSM